MDAPGLDFMLYSGNILNKSISWKKGTDAPDDEVYESLKSCFDGASGPVKNGTILEFAGDDLKNNNEDVDRQELKISLKVFLYSSEKTDLIASIENGLKNTSSEYLDTLVVTFSGHSEGLPISLELVKDAWTTLEEMVMADKVKVIGLSDVDTQLFIELHNWARIKPGIIQINLASCCVVPPELSEFCKQEGIQLLTHSDPINALSAENLNALIETLTSKEHTKSDSTSEPGLELKWVLRYQVHLKCRGVLATKGYAAAIHQVRI